MAKQNRTDGKQTERQTETGHNNQQGTCGVLNRMFFVMNGKTEQTERRKDGRTEQ
jgi:hypothetical protein